MIFFYLWVVSKTLLCGCGPDKKRYDFDKVRLKYTIDKIAVLPEQVTESSGLARAAGNDDFWTLNDGGSPPQLFRVGPDGALKEMRELTSLPNHDWEDLAQDRSGRLFIGDFGNNRNARRDLAVYILPESWEDRPEGKGKGVISFRYGQQSRFPEERKKRNFDSEAFFYHGDSLFLFSKNTGKAPRYTLMYRIPAQEGDYTLFPVDSIRLNETVTGADISPDGTQFALLTYGKVLFFDIKDGRPDFSSPSGCLKIFRGQTEAILYTGNGTMLITNEKGSVFRLAPK